MIIDHRNNIGRYTQLLPTLKNGIELLDSMQADGRLAEMSSGMIPFEGGRVVIASAETTAMDSKDFEYHSDYADVMLVLDGQEVLGYSAKEHLKETVPYSIQDDIGFASCTDDSTQQIHVNISKDYFYLLLPGEGHKPGSHIHSPTHFKKAIIKCLCTK